MSRSWRYATHRLMVMHPHTKYHWPTCISKDKKVMVQTSFAEKKRKLKKKIRLKQYVSLRSKGRLIKYLHVNRWKQLYIELNHCLLRNWISTKFYFKKNGIIFKLSQEQRSINTVSEDEWQARPMRSLP
jgi:hypothetical protein